MSTITRKMASRAKPPRTPSFRMHKPTGQGFAELAGHRQYLGRYDLPETREKYHRVLAEWVSNVYKRRIDPEELTIRELCSAYANHAEGYYGTKSGGLERAHTALKTVQKLYDSIPAKDFGPLALQAVIKEWIDQDLCRSTINDQLARIKRMFRWAVAQEMLPPSVYQVLNCVEGLRLGRSKAREPKVIGPVADVHVDAIEEFVSRPVWAAIQLQRFTGARSSEILMLRRCDIDTTGTEWTAVIKQHKNAFRGKPRVLCFGPQARAILRQLFIGKGPSDFLISPRDVFRERSESSDGHRRPNQKPTPRQSERTVREHYDSASYGRAIARAIVECNKKRIAENLPKVPHWHPHQLRHSYATLIRRHLGLEAVQAALGHSHAKTSEIYAESELAVALEVARKLG